MSRSKWDRQQKTRFCVTVSFAQASRRWCNGCWVVSAMIFYARYWSLKGQPMVSQRLPTIPPAIKGDLWAINRRPWRWLRDLERQSSALSTTCLLGEHSAIPWTLFKNWRRLWRPRQSPNAPWTIKKASRDLLATSGDLVNFLVAQGSPFMRDGGINEKSCLYVPTVSLSSPRPSQLYFVLCYHCTGEAGRDIVMITERWSVSTLVFLRKGSKDKKENRGVRQACVKLS